VPIGEPSSMQPRFEAACLDFQPTHTSVRRKSMPQAIEAIPHGIYHRGMARIDQQACVIQIAAFVPHDCGLP
jgi:hypothetical protein